MLRAIAITAFAALPAYAGELDSPAALYQFFVTRCGAITASPEAAVNNAFNQENARGSFTSDRSFVEYSEDLADVAIGKLLHFTSRMPGGEFSTCIIHLNDFEPDMYADLEAYVNDRAGSFLGGSYLKSGGTLRNEDTLTLTRSWTTKGFPPTASLTLVQNDFMVILRSNRAIPKPAEN